MSDTEVNFLEETNDDFGEKPGPVQETQSRGLIGLIMKKTNLSKQKASVVLGVLAVLLFVLSGTVLAMSYFGGNDHEESVRQIQEFNQEKLYE